MHDPYEIARAAAHDTELFTELADIATRPLVLDILGDPCVKVGGKYVPILDALHICAMRAAQGRADEAACIGQDTIAAIADASLVWAQGEAARREAEDEQRARDEDAEDRAHRRAA